MYASGLETFGKNAACAWRTSSAAMRSFNCACCKLETCVLARRMASSSAMELFVCEVGEVVCDVVGDVEGDAAGAGGVVAGELGDADGLAGGVGLV